jgi:hypothetical protein
MFGKDKNTVNRSNEHGFKNHVFSLICNRIKKRRDFGLIVIRVVLNVEVFFVILGRDLDDSVGSS